MIGQAPENGANASNWQDFLSQLGGLSVDYARHKLIDQERVGDDINIPDQADLRYGIATPVGQLSLGALLMLAAVVVGGVFLIRKLG